MLDQLQLRVVKVDGTTPSFGVFFTRGPIHESCAPSILPGGIFPSTIGSMKLVC